MAWILLTLAGLLEVVWATAMKASVGFTRPGPTALMTVTALASFWLLAQAMASLPLGTAYAIWVGIGALGTFALGAALYGEPLSAARLLSAGLILAGIIGLKLTAGSGGG